MGAATQVRRLKQSHLSPSGRDGLWRRLLEPEQHTRVRSCEAFVMSACSEDPGPWREINRIRTLRRVSKQRVRRHCGEVRSGGH
jgi:hypothetical protein